MTYYTQSEHAESSVLTVYIVDLGLSFMLNVTETTIDGVCKELGSWW